MKLRTSYKSMTEGFRQIAYVVNNLIDGRKGEVVLETGTATTTVSDVRIGVDSKVFLQAVTASAASEATSTYVSNINDGEFTVTHASNAVADRIFDYKIEG